MLTANGWRLKMGSHRAIPASSAFHRRGSRVACIPVLAVSFAYAAEPKKDTALAATQKTFSDYWPDASHWITLATGEYYPDILPHACELYKPVLVLFGQLVRGSESSVSLFMAICDVNEGWIRVQLARVFRKYVCPSLSVEMLRRKRQAKSICERFAGEFRKIAEVQKAFSSRPIPDEALCHCFGNTKTAAGRVMISPSGSLP